MDRTEHSVTATAVLGGVHPDMVHISDHADGGVGIHAHAPGVHVSLFGTLDDLVAVYNKIGGGLARVAADRGPETRTITWECSCCKTWEDFTKNHPPSPGIHAMLNDEGARR